MPYSAHSKMCRATSTCESARISRTAWRLTTLLGPAANPARPIILARWRAVPYLGLTLGKLFQFHYILRKELTTDCCDLRWRL